MIRVRAVQELTGKVAIVTGASRGIGRATAFELAGAGATVVVNYACNRAAADATAAAISAAGGNAELCQADITDAAECTRLFDSTIGRHGRVDILIANAGYAAFAPLAEMTIDEFDRVFAVNTRGSFLCLQQAARHLADNGRIVCLSTIGTILNPADGSAYFGSKAAVEQFCRVLAHEVAPRGITVNAVSPGFTDTDMLGATGGREPAAARRIRDLTPLARLGQPRDVARVIGFLVGPQGGWINRQNLAADGGIISR